MTGRSSALVACLVAALMFLACDPKTNTRPSGQPATPRQASPGPEASPEASSGPEQPPAPPPLEAMYPDVDYGDMPTANALLENVWPARGYPPVKLKWPLTWEEHYGDTFWAFMFYGLRYTSNLLWAFRKTGDARYGDRLIAILRSYVAYDRTRAYDRSTLDNEHATAFRAMTLVNSYVKLERAGVLPADLRQAIPTAIAKIARFLMEPKRFESHANHGFTEAAALLLIAKNFPDLAGAAKWRTTGIERLKFMLDTNLDSDGVDIENSPFYHLFVLGLVAQIGAWAEQYEPAVAKLYVPARGRMLRYAAVVTQPDGRLPMLGATATTNVPNLDDAVYGPLITLDPEFAWVYTRGKQGTFPQRRVDLFPSSGLFVLRAAYDAARPSAQTFVTFDAGIYRTEHSQLDALSLTLYSDGVALLPDSGLFTNDRGIEYDYFHGTRAHNTVVVDGADQPEGSATPIASGTSGDMAWATGESRLMPGVRHLRTVIVVRQGLLVVLDDLSSNARHSYAQTWHLFEGARPTIDDAAVTVENVNGDEILAIRQADPASLELDSVIGATDPMQGWLSAAYGRKVAAYALEYRRTGTNARFATLLVTGKAAAGDLSITQLGAGQDWLICDAGEATVLRVTAHGTAAENVAVDAGSGC